MAKPTTNQIIANARRHGLAIPAFNVPYLPMVEPVVRAIVDQDSFGLIASSRIEWTKFQAKGPTAVMHEYERWADPEHVRPHLDHVPVIDEDGFGVDYVPIFEEAIEAGFQSVMIDASRLPLEENIAATRAVCAMARAAGIACEGELGAVLGHEPGPLPPYEELFASGRGFTDVEEARRFVQETGCDWLSVAVGNIHGAVAEGMRDKQKVSARLNLEHLDKLRQAAGVPLVLHGGSGIQQEYILQGVKRGIAKINIGTDIRQSYERALAETASVSAAKDAVYDRTCWILRDYLGMRGARRLLTAAN
ncbi:MAG: class II fructose-bisphosphate aldolase [Chloroflexi bacterium]|nr:class II fructose-bisphosphate aldolase [Chloroflexota bacterium]